MIASPLLCEIEVSQVSLWGCWEGDPWGIRWVLGRCWQRPLPLAVSGPLLTHSLLVQGGGGLGTSLCLFHPLLLESRTLPGDLSAYLPPTGPDQSQWTLGGMQCQDLATREQQGFCEFGGWV